MPWCRVMAVLILLFVCSGSALAQGMGPGVGKYRFLSEDEIARVPFESKSDHVVVTAEINGKTSVRLILDTGMPMPGLILVGKSDLNLVDFNFVGEMPIPGDAGNAGPQMAKIADGVSLEFPGLQLTEMAAIVEPADGNMASMLGNDDGIIGSELFRQFAVTIDYDNNVIILTKPDRFQTPPNAVELPLMMRNGFPWLKCSAEMIGGAVAPMELVVDLGASHAISLNVGTHEAIVPPDNSIETLLGRTVSGPIYGKVGRINSLRLGDLELRDVMSSFQTGPRHGPSAMEKQGNLGHGVLGRFNVTFDYTSMRMILVPNTHFDEPFEYNMTGIEYSKTGEGLLKVDRILPGSPAQEAGVRPDDLIHSINGTPMSEIERGVLRKILRESGSRVTLALSSPDGTSREVTLTLRRLI